MSRSLWTLSMAVALCGTAYAKPAASGASAAVGKAGAAVERGVKAAASGIERGAKAVERGVKIAASGVERGAKAAGGAIDSAARKVGVTPASAPAR